MYYGNNIVIIIFIHCVNIVQGSVEDVFRFTTFCVQFAGYVGLFVLTLLPEPHSRRASYTLLYDDHDQVGILMY